MSPANAPRSCLLTCSARGGACLGAGGWGGATAVNPDFADVLGADGLMAPVASGPPWGTRGVSEALCSLRGGLGPRVLGSSGGTKVPAACCAAPSSSTCWAKLLGRLLGTDGGQQCSFPCWPTGCASYSAGFQCCEGKYINVRPLSFPDSLLPSCLF